MTITANEIDNIINAQPASNKILGLSRDLDSGYLTITVFIPDANAIEIIDKKSGKSLGALKKVHSHGLFHLKLRRKKCFKYQLKLILNDEAKFIDDPHSFGPTLSELDLHLLHEGNHQQPYKKLGAHLMTHQEVLGVSFAVWAPNASRVSVVGDFNQWDNRCHPLTNLEHYGNKSGYWNIFIPQAHAGQCYKFDIKNNQGERLPLKADPYGVQAQYRPETASIIGSATQYPWQDAQWLNKRASYNSRNAAISIYEVHLGSWRRNSDNLYLNYREIAHQLVPYVKEMAFTHIQLMPVSEFPFDGSWGYQPVGLFAPTARFGTEQDFQYFVDFCHQHDIGLLIDWVPGHFPSDDHGLALFDGSYLFEHEDPRQGFHPDWNTLIYNYGRTEVSNFLRASALHWFEKFHLDGIRVDAVASMLYLDYSRKEGEWIPNEHGGRENLAAVKFIQRFNEELYQQFPDAFSVAEESTSWPGVSKPTSDGGLGFGYKWNMGWMNDTLEYIKRDPIYRKHHHDEISFGLVYAFDENFVLPLSHDEVVHGKGSMLAKMPGDCWQQFANLRAYYGFMWAHPGKKLLFMGCEFAQGREWDHNTQLDWHQLDIHWHSSVQQLVKDLNHVYRQTPALHQLDCQTDGFSWLDHQNSEQSLYSFIRFDELKNQPVVVVCNFANQTHHDFRLGVPKAGTYQEVLNTDAKQYSGSGQVNNDPIHSSAFSWQQNDHNIIITVPALATVILKFVEAN